MLLDQDLTGLHQVPGLAAIQANGLDVGLQTIEPQGQNLGRRIGHREQAPRGLVDPDIGGLGRQQHCGEQLKHRGVFQLRHRQWIGCAKGRKEGLDGIAFHRSSVGRRPVDALGMRVLWPVLGLVCHFD